MSIKTRFIFPIFSREDVKLIWSIFEKCNNLEDCPIKIKNANDGTKQVWFISSYENHEPEECSIGYAPVVGPLLKVFIKMTKLVINVSREMALSVEDEYGNKISKSMSGPCQEAATVDSIVDSIMMVMDHDMSKQNILYFLESLVFKLATGHLWKDGNKRTTIISLIYISEMILHLYIKDSNDTNNNPKKLKDFIKTWTNFIKNVADCNNRTEKINFEADEIKWKKIIFKNEDKVREFIRENIVNNLLISFKERVRFR